MQEKTISFTWSIIIMIAIIAVIIGVTYVVSQEGGKDIRKVQAVELGKVKVTVTAGSAYIVYAKVQFQFEKREALTLIPVLSFLRRTVYNPDQILEITADGSGSGDLSFSLRRAGQQQVVAGETRGNLLFFEKSPCIRRAFITDGGSDSDPDSEPIAGTIYYGADPQIEESDPGRAENLEGEKAADDLIRACANDFVLAVPFVVDEVFAQ